jgi:regulator of sigma E protease
VTTILSFIVVIGVLILIHELGHFFVARWTGVGVERFSIGFGPVLLRWRGRETEYCLSAIPMGGYVKMMGEESPVEGGGAQAYDPGKAFASKPLWARFLIVFAGPGMNFVLAAVIAAIVLGTAGRPVWPPVLGKVAPDGPAAAAGLATGDTVVAVDGRRVTYWEDVERAVAGSDGRPLTLVVRRDGEEREVTVPPQRRTVPDPIFRDPKEVWDVGTGPRAIPQISAVSADSPAERAGLQPGDTVREVAGVPVFSPEELVEQIRTRPGQTFPMTVERDGRTFAVMVTPEAVVERSPAGDETEIGKIQAGIATRAVSFEAYDPARAVWYGIRWTKDTTAITLRGLWKLIVGTIERTNIGGPIQIASMAGQQAREGLVQLAMFTAVISVNLAILNLLPIPMLDGGHLLFFLIEAVLGRPLSLRKREMAQQIGLVLLLALMGFAVYNDLVRIGALKLFGG